MRLRPNSERRAPQVYQGDGTYRDQSIDADSEAVIPAMVNIKHVRKSGASAASAASSSARQRNQASREDPHISVPSDDDGAPQTVRNHHANNSRQRARSAKQEEAPPAKKHILPASFPSLGPGETPFDRFKGGRHGIVYLVHSRCEAGEAMRIGSFNRGAALWSGDEKALKCLPARERAWYAGLKKIRLPESAKELIQLQSLRPSLRVEIIDQIILECQLHRSNGFSINGFDAAAALIGLSRYSLDTIMAASIDTNIPSQIIYNTELGYLDPDHPNPNELALAVKFLEQRGLPGSLLGQYQIPLEPEYWKKFEVLPDAEKSPEPGSSAPETEAKNHVAEGAIQTVIDKRAAAVAKSPSPASLLEEQLIPVNNVVGKKGHAGQGDQDVGFTEKARVAYEHTPHHQGNFAIPIDMTVPLAATKKPSSKDRPAHLHANAGQAPLMSGALPTSGQIAAMRTQTPVSPAYRIAGTVAQDGTAQAKLAQQRMQKAMDINRTVDRSPTSKNFIQGSKGSSKAAPHGYHSGSIPSSNYADPSETLKAPSRFPPSQPLPSQQSMAQHNLPGQTHPVRRSPQKPLSIWVPPVSSQTAPHQIVSTPGAAPVSSSQTPPTPRNVEAARISERDGSQARKGIHTPRMSLAQMGNYSPRGSPSLQRSPSQQALQQFSPARPRTNIPPIPPNPNLSPQSPSRTAYPRPFGVPNYTYPCDMLSASPTRRSMLGSSFQQHPAVTSPRAQPRPSFGMDTRFEPLSPRSPRQMPSPRLGYQYNAGVNMSPRAQHSQPVGALNHSKPTPVSPMRNARPTLGPQYQTAIGSPLARQSPSLDAIARQGPTSPNTQSFDPFRNPQSPQHLRSRTGFHKSIAMPPFPDGGPQYSPTAEARIRQFNQTTVPSALYSVPRDPARALSQSVSSSQTANMASPDLSSPKRLKPRIGSEDNAALASRALQYSPSRSPRTTEPGLRQHSQLSQPLPPQNPQARQGLQRKSVALPQTQTSYPANPFNNPGSNSPAFQPNMSNSGLSQRSGPLNYLDPTVRSRIPHSAAMPYPNPTPQDGTLGQHLHRNTANISAQVLNPYPVAAQTNRVSPSGSPVRPSPIINHAAQKTPTPNFPTLAPYNVFFPTVPHQSGNSIYPNGNGSGAQSSMYGTRTHTVQQPTTALVVPSTTDESMIDPQLLSGSVAQAPTQHPANVSSAGDLAGNVSPEPRRRTFQQSFDAQAGDVGAPNAKRKKL